MRESTFRENPSAGRISCNWHFAQDFRNSRGFHAAVWTRGKLAAKVTEPISFPPMLTETDLYSTRCFSACTLTDIQHTEMLYMCVLWGCGLPKGSAERIFLPLMQCWPLSGITAFPKKLSFGLRRMTKQEKKYLHILNITNWLMLLP